MYAAVESEEEEQSPDDVVHLTDRTTPDTSNQPDAAAQDVDAFSPDNDTDSDESDDGENA